MVFRGRFVMFASFSSLFHMVFGSERSLGVFRKVLKELLKLYAPDDHTQLAAGDSKMPGELLRGLLGALQLYHLARELFDLRTRRGHAFG